MRTARRVAGLSILLGLPVGVVWWLLAPLPRAVKRADGVYYAGVTESSIAADGWFAVCALVVGALSGLLVAMLVRRDRLPTLAALAVGGLAGAVLAWQVGQWLGPPSFPDQAALLREGARFDGPLRVSALGVLLVWPISAVILFFGVVAGLDAMDTVDESAPAEAEPVSPLGAPERSSHL